ncbi:Not5p [Malassezia vespertilionis]|uniref:Not5p n=1 Tax=Malassezia vespertilionis TaxID=2020962 RepID=A0A2N1JAC2_9BASI|nr:Not5p [Malassezia vespertilionis]
MKTKAFSKEGLIAAARMDPSEKAKLEMSQWLATMVDELSRQIEMAEAEIEQTAATTKKKKGSVRDERVGQMEHWNERRNWHISRLEILLRMLENDTLEVERINDIREDILYFVECNTDEDFDEDDGIYDEFNLDNEEEVDGPRENEDEDEESSEEPDSVATATEDIARPEPAVESPQPQLPSEEAKKEEPSAPQAPKPAKEEKKASAKKAVEAPTKERVVTNFDQGKVQTNVSPVPAAKPAAPLPPIRYAAAAAAAVASPSTSAPVPAGDSIAEQESVDPEETASHPAPAHGATDARLPDSLSDLVASYEYAKQKSLMRDANLMHMQRSLDSGYVGGVPEPVDSESPKYYVPKEPLPTPHYYPQTPASIFDNPALYAKFDVDTLFFIFYYQQGTYHQYLAARELKKQSWRFHKQYLTWFQRHSEPQAITDEYEQGAYVYFDWEGSWCQRRKSDFRFEYRWLEDN